MGSIDQLVKVIFGVEGADEAARKTERLSGALMDVGKAYVSWTAVRSGSEALYAGVKAGAAYQEQLEALDRMTRRYGTTAQAMLGQIDAAGKGLITGSEALAVAADTLNRGGLNPDQLAQLASAAEVFSNITAEDPGEVFRNLTDAITMNRTRGLLPYMGTLEELNADLSDSEKVHTRFEQVIARAAERAREFAGAADSLDDKLLRLENTVGKAKKAFNLFLATAAAESFDDSSIIGEGILMAVGTGKIGRASCRERV